MSYKHDELIKEKMNKGRYGDIDQEFIERERKLFNQKVANELPNSTTYNNLGTNALYLITTLPEEERTQEHVTSKGETKTPDEMTVRELRESIRLTRHEGAEIQSERRKEK
ncbi:hypothetical protein ACFFIF_08020 [Vagococcus entomophilus]|uniref:hypothetical protein n=1 Tax=Vagococcus entomophilus TaxID=1160095 RepID=UPI000F85DC70|nr:hypothetical protein [Vagococcus entomophilus]